MIITITEVEQEFTKNGDEYRKVKGTTPDGKETTKSVFNNLEDSWGLLEEGTTLEFKMEKKGQFWNVASIKPVTDKASPASPSTGNGDMSKDDWAEKQRIERESIEAQKRADITSQLWIAGKIKDDDPLVTKMRDWLGNDKQASTPAEVPTKKDEAKTEGGAELPAFKSGVDLVNYALKHGWKLSDIREALGITEPTEIDDVAKATTILFPDKVAQ